MAGITMCLEHQCTRKESCYRYMAKQDPYWQSFFMHNPREGKQDADCPEYIKMQTTK